MSPGEWLATHGPEGSGETAARPTVYRRTQFRSALEAGWACTLDHLGIEWEYERRSYRLPSGTWYLPDLWLPAVRTFIEVKGAHAQRIHKPQELAEEVNADVIVLIGWPPVRVSYSPYTWESKLQWRDPLGYDTRLARCPACSHWQWMRAQLSRQCRVCDASHTGLLAKAGEMPFYAAEPDRPSWMGGR